MDGGREVCLENLSGRVRETGSREQNSRHWVDISPEYICSAKKRFGSRGRFFCSDVGLATIEEEQGTFDLVLAIGVIHHLDDAQAAKLFDLARLALRPTGRLVTYDGCYVPDQSKIARWFLSHDRGNFIRARAEYLRLASARFDYALFQLSSCRDRLSQFASDL